MEEQTASATVKNSLQSSKDFVAKKYHNLANFVTRTYTAHKEKGRNTTLKMYCAKYALVIMDIVYLLTSLLMINIGVLGRIANLNFRLAYQLELLPICWMGTGVILLFVSIFGLIGAFKESKVWTNIFGLLMTIVFVTQISSAIYAFHFIGQSKWIASTAMERLMNGYGWNQGYPWAMDWIQKHYECCGSHGPTDWGKYSPYRRRESNSYNNYYYRSTTSTTTLSTPLPDRMPSSCCTDSSNYNELSCDHYYQNGCSAHLREMIAATTMIIGSIALGIAVFEVLGIAFAFPAARVLRKTKSMVAMQLYETLGSSTENRKEPKADENVETV